MGLKITTLIENMQDEKKELFYEHGLSLLIDNGKKKILFDTGQTGAFLDNAKEMGFTAETPDLLISSHGHYDHSGGVMRFLKERKSAIDIYVGEGYFNPKYKILPDKSYKFNGNGFGKEDLEKWNLHEVSEDVTDLGDGIYIFKNFEKYTDYEKVNPRFYLKAEDGYVRDYFKDEIALGVKTEMGFVVIVGCSHPGIINMLKTIASRMNCKIVAVAGGTHLVEADEKRIDLTIDAMKELGVECIAVSHCTGEDGMKRIKEAFPDHFIRNNTGNEFYID